MATAARRLPFLTAVLLAVEFLDELASGVPGTAASTIQETFTTGNLEVGALITAFGLLAVLLEPPLFVLADHYPRRWFVCGGLLVLAFACTVAAASANYWMLFTALLVFGPASGCGVSLSQATLVDENRSDPESALARWTLAGALGDLCTPALMAICLRTGLGWRGAFLFCGALSAVLATMLWRPLRPPAVSTAPSDAGADRRSNEGSDEEKVPPLRILRSALTNRTLLIWGLALVACSLLDETFVAFFVLYATDSLAWPIDRALAVVAAVSAGGIVSLAAFGRLRVALAGANPLLVSCGTSLLGLVALVVSREFTVLIVAGFLLGAGVGVQYPLAKARLYRALPGQSGTALAVAGLFAPLELVLPLAVGWLADTAGLTAALLMLGLQPVLLIAADALVTMPSRH